MSDLFYEQQIPISIGKQKEAIKDYLKRYGQLSLEKALIKTRPQNYNTLDQQEKRKIDSKIIELYNEGLQYYIKAYSLQESEIYLGTKYRDKLDNIIYECYIDNTTDIDRALLNRRHIEPGDQFFIAFNYGIPKNDNYMIKSNTYIFDSKSISWEKINENVDIHVKIDFSKELKGYINIIK